MADTSTSSFSSLTFQHIAPELSFFFVARLTRVMSAENSAWLLGILPEGSTQGTMAQMFEVVTSEGETLTCLIPEATHADASRSQEQDGSGQDSSGQDSSDQGGAVCNMSVFAVGSMLSMNAVYEMRSVVRASGQEGWIQVYRVTSLAPLGRSPVPEMESSPSAVPDFSIRSEELAGA